MPFGGFDAVVRLPRDPVVDLRSPRIPDEVVFRIGTRRVLVELILGSGRSASGCRRRAVGSNESHVTVGQGC